jgi:hypothetical protein
MNNIKKIVILSIAIELILIGGIATAAYFFGETRNLATNIYQEAQITLQENYLNGFAEQIKECGTAPVVLEANPQASTSSNQPSFVLTCLATSTPSK